jgi:glutathione S-transferase
MKLYCFPVAPNPTKVRLFLAEKAAAGRPLNVEEVTVSLPEGEQNEPEHAARNPFKRLPVLELDDGGYILESLAIIEYLDELFPEPSLIGRTARERAATRQMERIIETGVMNQIARYVHATNSPLGLPPNEQEAATARTTLEKTLAVLDTWFADGRSFAAGGEPSIADCTLAAGLHFGRFGGVQFVEAYPNVAAWDRRYRQRPAAKAVLLD